MKKLSFKILVVLAVFASLFVFVPKATQKAYAASDVVTSNYLADSEGNAYESSVEAGNVTGYKGYLLGTNANLIATANEGFVFRGWRVEGELKTETFEETINGATTTFTIANQTNKGTLSINPIHKDLEIQAVFEYDYFNFSLDEDIIRTLSLNSETKNVNGTDVEIKYETASTAASVTTYVNAIVNNNYYPSLNFDGTSLYTEQIKMDGTSTKEKVDYSLGAYRLNDVVTFKFNIKIEEDELNSSNVDIQGFSVTSGSGNSAVVTKLSKSTLLYENTYIVETEALKRSKNLAIYTSITKARDHKLSWNVHKLFVVDIVPMIDGSTIQILESDTQEVKNFKQSEIDFVLNNIDVYERGFFAKVSDSRYLVKNSTQQGGFIFRLNCRDTISNTVDGENYEYYKFDTMYGREIQQQTFNPIANLEIPVNYNSRKYELTFDFRLYQNGEITKILDKTFNIEGVNEVDTGLSRGQNVVVSETNVTDNVGYKLFGFYEDISSITPDSKNSSISLTMDLIKPSNTTIYVLLEKVEYKINIVSANNISLSNAGTIYPINTVILNNNTIGETVYGVDLYTNGYKTLTNSIRIGDVFTLAFANNNGFKIGVSARVNEKPTAGNMQNTQIEQSYTVDETFIETYIEEIAGVNPEYVVNFYVHAEYDSFSVTYKIDKRLDGVDEVIMADIYATVKNTQTGEENTINSTQVDANGAEYISFEGLKLYDVVIMYATPRPYQEVYYLFDRFTPNGVTRLPYTSTADELNPKLLTYSHAHTVSANEVIAVVFAPPKVQLSVEIENADVYLLENVKVYQNVLNEETGLEEEKELPLNSGAYDVQVGDVRVVLENLETIKYGYYYKECNLSFIGATAEDVETLTGNELTFTLTNSVPYMLEIVCPEVIFETYVKQHGARITTDGELVDFGGETFKELTLSSSVLSFDLPGEGGIYVAGAFFNGELLEGFEQDSDATSLIYVKTLSVDEFKLFAETTNADRIQIVIDVNYEITMYKLVVNLVNNSTKANGYEDLTQQVNLSLNGIYTVEKEPNKYIFSNIPYATTGLVLTANVASNSGLNAEQWKNIKIGVVSESLSSITFQTITASGELDYYLTYVEYTVKLEYNEEQGSPLVNNTSFRTNVSVGDELQIKSGAFGASGYKFTAMYQAYVYSNSSWELEKLNLYYLEDSVLVLNTIETYDSTKSYYKKIDTDVQNTTMFTDSKFYPYNYYVNGTEIKVLVVYDYIKIVISHQAKMSGKGTIKNPDSNEVIPVSDFASYYLFVNDVPLDINSVFTVADGMVTVVVKMNSIFCTINGEVVEINLGRGVVLNNPTIYGLADIMSPTFMDNTYVFQMDVSKLISSMVDNNLIDYSKEYSTLTIEYPYAISKVTVEMTTNIPSSIDQPSSFYSDVDASSNRLFLMESSKGANSILNEVETGILTDSQTFMQKTNFSYSFTNPFTEYFRIRTYEVYYKNRLLEKEEYALYGITEIRVGDSFTLDIRYIEGVKIVLNVETQINFSDKWNGNELTRAVKYNAETGTIENQTLNIGYQATDDIYMAQFIYEQAKVAQNVEYYSESGELKPNGPDTVGKYLVKIDFVGEGNYAWLSEISIPYNIYFIISKLELKVGANTTVTTIEKPYDQKSDISFVHVQKQLVLTGQSSSGTTFNINLNENTPFSLVCTRAYTCDTTGAAVTSASDVLHRVKVEGLALDVTNTFLNNFTLDVSEYIVPACAKINKCELTLTNLQLYDKVYDGTTNVELVDLTFVKLIGVKAGDDVRIDFDKLQIAFEDANIGLNKDVVINTDECLTGDHKDNYVITLSDVVQKPSIFPYSVSVNVSGIGEIKLVNERGLTDKSCVSLIPIGAKLEVQTIENGTPEYVAIYPYISRFITGNRVFAVGYKLKLNVGGEKIAPSNQLYLSVPEEKNLMGVISLSGEESIELKYSKNDSTVLIDLSQVKTDVDHVILTKQRILFKLWQIILVASIAVVTIGGIVVTVVIVRRRKLKKYSINEKI